MVKIRILFNQIFKRKYLIYYLGFFTFCLTLLLRDNPTAVFKYYTNGLYVVIANILSVYSSIFSFSLADAALIVIICLILIAIGIIIYKRKYFKPVATIALKLLVGIYIAFYWLWGFNYFGSNIYQRSILTSEKISEQQFITILDSLIAETNRNYQSFSSINTKQIDSLIENIYAEQANKLGINYPLGKRRTKTIILSRYYSGAGISGYFLPFFNETHLNNYLLPVQYPVVLAHEKAHQFGITSEAEANFYAWYICNHSESEQLKFSANLYMLRHFLRQTNYQEIEPLLKNKIDQVVLDDFEKIRKHYLALRIETVDKINWWLYNNYLKANQIPDGVKNYGGVVKMICEYETAN